MFTDYTGCCDRLPEHCVCSDDGIRCDCCGERVVREDAMTRGGDDYCLACWSDIRAEEAEEVTKS